MKKKIFGILGAMCMALVMMPMTVKAAPTTSVKIAGVQLNSTTPYYHNGAAGAVGTADNIADEANAIFDAATGTLTLNNLEVESDAAGIWWEYSYNAEHELIVVLADGSINSISRTDNGSGINGECGFGDAGPKLIIQGNGTLNITGGTNGIYVWDDVTFSNGAVVNLTGTSKNGILGQGSHSTFTIESGAIVTLIGNLYGCAGDYGDASVVLNGGTLNATGGTAAFQKTPTLNSDKLWTVNVGADAGTAATWDGTTDLKDYKYVSITYARDKTQLTGTASISGTAKLGEILTAALENSNGTGTLTYTWEAGGNILQTGAENTYTINDSAVIGQTITVTISDSEHLGSLVSQPTAAVEKKDAASVPSNLDGVQPTAEGGTDGKITGTDATMEYSTGADFANKTTCGDTETTGLAAGTYYVRFAETADTKASNYVTVTVPERIIVESGTVENNTNKETNECKAELEEGSDDLTGKVLTAEDQQKVTAGKDVKIWLEVTAGENKATDADKTLTQAKLEEYTLGKYLDFVLWKQIEGEAASKVAATSGTVTVKFVVPQELINTDSNKTRAYKIIRVHDDGTGAKAEVISCDYEAATNMVSFETDKFSIYSLIYKDTVTNVDTGNNNNNNNVNDNDDDDDDEDYSAPVEVVDQWDDVPKTGEANTIGLLLGMAAVAAVGAFLTGRKKKEL